MEVACQRDTVLKTGHMTQRSLQTTGFLHTCRHMWAEQVHRMLEQYCQTTYSTKQRFWEYGHGTEYWDESILNLEMLNKLNNQRVYTLVNTDKHIYNHFNFVGLKIQHLYRNTSYTVYSCVIAGFIGILNTLVEKGEKVQ